MKDLQSSLREKGDYVTQIIHFVDGVKRTFEGVSTSKIKQGQMTKMRKTDGSMVLINDANVLCIEVFKEDE